MYSIRDIISSLNETIELPKGSEKNGVAELVTKDESTIPEIDGKFVGVDDKYPARLYHRLLSVSTKLLPNKGYGDSAGDISNTYSISMVVFLQHERAKLYPDELLLFIQSQFPDKMKGQPYNDITITFSGAQLDSQSNWNQEYRSGTDYRLKSDQFLFKINYSIETKFSKGCFNECP
jgi:hypothetical protein